MTYRKKGTRRKYKQGAAGEVRKAYNQPVRLMTKIQSVTLNWEVSVAMNLLGGRQCHRQRLIPTEESGLQDTAMINITAWLLFLDLKAWLIRLYTCLFNFHLWVWTQFCGQLDSNRYKPFSHNINHAAVCYHARRGIRNTQTEVFRE